MTRMLTAGTLLTLGTLSLAAAGVETKPGHPASRWNN